MTAFAALQPSFDAVTPPASPGDAGTTIDLGAIQDQYLLYAVVAGTSDDRVSVYFEGSIDGSTWYQLTTSELVYGGQADINSGNTIARYVRAQAFTSEGSPVLTASVGLAVS